MSEKGKASHFQEVYTKKSLVLKSRRGAVGETWWSKRFVRALEGITADSRLSRGKSYARNGYVSSIRYQAGVVQATVRGSMRTPYKVTITFRDYTDDEWESVFDGMAGQAIITARLLSGEMPEELEEVFASAGLSLFPKSYHDIITTCSCPDWENPCKHIAAVYYILTEWFDENPFFLFGLRGMGREELLDTLRKKREAATVADAGAKAEIVPADENEATDAVCTPAAFSPEDYLRNFWKAGPDLDSFALRFNDESVPAIRQLGDSPFTLGGKNLSERLLPVYPAAQKYARDLAKMERSR